jgi:hypothetical protein
MKTQDIASYIRGLIDTVCKSVAHEECESYTEVELVNRI